MSRSSSVRSTNSCWRSMFAEPRKAALRACFDPRGLPPCAPRPARTAITGCSGVVPGEARQVDQVAATSSSMQACPAGRPCAGCPRRSPAPRAAPRPAPPRPGTAWPGRRWSRHQGRRQPADLRHVRLRGRRHRPERARLERADRAAPGVAERGGLVHPAGQLGLLRPVGDALLVDAADHDEGLDQVAVVPVRGPLVVLVGQRQQDRAVARRPARRGPGPAPASRLCRYSAWFAPAMASG